MVSIQKVSRGTKAGLRRGNCPENNLGVVFIAKPDSTRKQDSTASL